MGKNWASMATAHLRACKAGGQPVVGCSQPAGHGTQQRLQRGRRRQVQARHCHVAGAPATHASRPSAILASVWPWSMRQPASATTCGKARRGGSGEDGGPRTLCGGSAAFLGPPPHNPPFPATPGSPHLHHRVVQRALQRGAVPQVERLCLLLLLVPLHPEHVVLLGRAALGLGRHCWGGSKAAWTAGSGGGQRRVGGKVPWIGCRRSHMLRARGSADRRLLGERACSGGGAGLLFWLQPRSWRVLSC